MKKLISLVMLTASVICATPASAYLIQGGSFAGTNVGGLDTLIGQTTGLANSSPKTETSWANTLLNPDTTYVTKEESVSYFATESASVFAFELQTEPGYFIVKNARWWALFENNASADWGVVDFSQLNSAFNFPDLSDMTISHVSEFGKFVDVTEPSTLWLFCIGLVGFGAARRKLAAG